jgi:cytochrome P450
MTDTAELLSLADPAVLANPHDLFARLRETQPVLQVTDPRGEPIYLVTSYALVEEVTKRTDDFSSRFGHLLSMPNPDNAEAMGYLMRSPEVSGLLLTNDDPGHKRHRALVNAAFAHGRVAHMEPIIQRLIDDLIDGFVARGECDFVGEFAVLLPTFLIADILGLDRQDFGRLREWSDCIIRIGSRMGSREQETADAKGIAEFVEFMRALVASRRASPRDDLISNLVTAQVEGIEPLNDDEATRLSIEIAVAGNETTRNTLMSGIVQLLRHPDQMHDLAQDPSLAANAVEELLRYETPATSMWRVATRDTQLGGVTLTKGSALLLRFDAANRDPAKFAEPNRLDIRRKNARTHVAFGAPGIHRCLGQMLARKELAIAFPLLLNRLRNLRIAVGSDTQYWPGLLHRGIASLRLSFDRATPQSEISA